MTCWAQEGWMPRLRHPGILAFVQPPGTLVSSMAILGCRLLQATGG